MHSTETGQQMKANNGPPAVWRTVRRSAVPRNILAAALAALMFAAAVGVFADAEQADAAVSRSKALVIGAEQEPDCADWIASCSGSLWGFYMMNVTTIPRAMDPVKTATGWGWKPNSMLSGAPVLVTDPKQIVTYPINPKAVWSDGSPITSSDFKYTWEQIVTGDDIYDQTGYKDIESVDDSNPAVAVVSFARNYSAWRQLFSGGYGILPAHLLAGKDRAAAMKDGYRFSGGPWKIKSWKKGETITLVPNDRWWGPKSSIAKIVFKFIPDTSAQFLAYKRGEISMIFPQPQPDVVDAIKRGRLPAGGKARFSADTGSIEALWINNAKPPFDDERVRQAFAFAIDRKAVVSRLFGALGVKEPSNSINPPILSSYSDTSGYEVYTKDLKKVDQLMKSAGYKRSGKYWRKGSRTAEITLTTTKGNSLRELTVGILATQLKGAGFLVNIELAKPGDLFGQMLPDGDYAVGLYGQTATAPEPGLCAVLCAENIPSAANDHAGQNFTRTNVAGLDTQLQAVDASLAEPARIAASREADLLMAKAATILPLDPLPNILLWNKTLTGPIDNNPILGPFWNMHAWKLSGN